MRINVVIMLLVIKFLFTFYLNNLPRDLVQAVRIIHMHRILDFTSFVGKFINKYNTYINTIRNPHAY